MTYNKRQRLQLDLSQSIGSYGSFLSPATSRITGRRTAMNAP